MVVQLTVILNVDVEGIIEELMQSDQTSDQTSKQLLAMLKVVGGFKDNGQNDEKTAIKLAVA